MMNNFGKLILNVLCVAVLPVFVFIQCGNGQQKNDLSPEVRQIIGQMESPDDETAKDVFISLREQTLEKITANLLEENDNIVVIEAFTSAMKKYTSTIYTPHVQMNFTGEAERSNVRTGSNRSLTGAYTLIENDNVPDQTFEIIDAFSNDRLDEYISGRNRIPSFSNSVCLIAVIKNDSGNITVSNFKTR
ncbi:MAG: hypothetical protein LBK27_05455 [Treponema sp.]|nr:hypothetical protein [Treponema sp.]